MIYPQQRERHEEIKYEATVSTPFTHRCRLMGKVIVLFREGLGVGVEGGGGRGMEGD